MPDTEDGHLGPDVPFLAAYRESEKSYGGIEGIVPIQRKEAVEFELSSCLGCILWLVPQPGRFVHSCPLCTVCVLSSIETIVGIYGILLGIYNIDVTCERKLQIFVIAFGTLQLLQTSSSVGLIFKPKKWRSLESWFAPVLITAAFSKFTLLILGCALVFGRKGQCDKNLLREAKWYVCYHAILMASSFCYAVLLVHPSFAPNWPKSKRRRASIEVGRRQHKIVQMTELRTSSGRADADGPQYFRPDLKV
mmetsp:Transcript_16485/g.23047  ORF Transcript_16485/g.23047 Transcript_16485/m.23047 type:complete len:250 (-) Transcript_16485:298-1047(-)